MSQAEVKLSVNSSPKTSVKFHEYHSLSTGTGFYAIEDTYFIVVRTAHNEMVVYGRMVINGGSLKSSKLMEEDDAIITSFGLKKDNLGCQIHREGPVYIYKPDKGGTLNKPVSECCSCIVM